MTLNTFSQYGHTRITGLAFIYYIYLQMCALLQSADKRTVSKCLVQLSIFLCHKFPRIRKFTAAKLFEAILTYSDRDIVPEENLDSVNSILSDTNWDLAIDELRPIRNGLCDLMGIQAPAVIKKPV